MGVKNRIWILMGKKLSGSLTPEEEQELDGLFQTYPDVWYTFEVLNSLEEKEAIPQAFINEIETLLRYDEIDTADKVDEVRAIKPAISRLWIKTGIAATVLFSVSLAAILGYKYLNKTSTPANVNNEVVVQNGTKTDMVLPDGSRIILNSGSRLTYPKNYASADVREVFLSGEAYFKIVHDKQHPFIIHTAHFDIKDIGTTFNVKAYPGEKVTEASLIEGAIEISFKNSTTKKIMLKPSQKITLANNDLNNKDQTGVEKVDHNADDYELATLIVDKKIESKFAEIAWINNELVFKNEAFEDLAKRMERRYNVEITFGDAKIKHAYLTGIFRNENIEQALKVLQLITPFKYQINRDKILIRSL
jgi:ferric-dicitrate binding protein FerR (iron transport regulator)